MEHKDIYSIVLVLRAEHDITLPAITGSTLHGAFLNLIRQFDAPLSARLHDEPGYRPYTLSPLVGVDLLNGKAVIRRGQDYRLRLTLLDGGAVWNGLRTHFLEHAPLLLSLHSSRFQITRMLFTPGTDAAGWVQATTWQNLVTLSPKPIITLHFVSPTAFSYGERQFELFPHPRLLWESILRAWNTYTPSCFAIEKKALDEWITRYVAFRACNHLHTDMVQLSTHVQKGFLGTCQYELTELNGLASCVTSLAAFAFYTGIGYKTTMGMGQVQVSFDNAPESSRSLALV